MIVLHTDRDWGYRWLNERDSGDLQGYGRAEDSGDSGRQEGN